MKPVTALSVAMLFFSFFPFMVSADSQLETTTKLCDNGFQDIERRTYDLIGASEISDDGVKELKTYITECLDTATSLSQGKRDEFRELITRLTHSIEGIQASLATSSVLGEKQEG
jgi:hypothetical protein